MDDVSEPRHTEGIDDDISDDHRTHGSEDLAVIALGSQQSADGSGDDEAEQVATSRTGRNRPAVGVVRVPRDADHAECHVQRHGQSATLPTQCRTGDEDTEGLARDRDGCEREVDVDLSQYTDEQGSSSDECDVREDRSRNQVGEDTTLRGDGKGYWASHRGRLLSGSWSCTLGQC